MTVHQLQIRRDECMARWLHSVLAHGVSSAAL